MPSRTADEIALEIRTMLQTTLTTVFEARSVAFELIQAFSTQLAETERRTEDMVNNLWHRNWNKIDEAREEAGLIPLVRPSAPWKITK